MRIIDIFKTFLISLSLVIFVSCSGSDSNGSGELEEVTLSDLHGFWIATTDLEGSTHIFLDKDKSIIYFISDMDGCWGEDENYTFVFDEEEQTILVNGDVNDITYNGKTLTITNQSNDEVDKFNFVSSDIADEDQCI